MERRKRHWLAMDINERCPMYIFRTPNVTISRRKHEGDCAWDFEFTPDLEIHFYLSVVNEVHIAQLIQLVNHDFKKF